MTQDGVDGTSLTEGGIVGTSLATRGGVDGTSLAVGGFVGTRLVTKGGVGTSLAEGGVVGTSLVTATFVPSSTRVSTASSRCGRPLRHSDGICGYSLLNVGGHVA